MDVKRDLNALTMSVVPLKVSKQTFIVYLLSFRLRMFSINRIWKRSRRPHSQRPLRLRFPAPELYQVLLFRQPRQLQQL